VGETLLLVKRDRVIDSGGDVAFSEELAQGVAPISRYTNGVLIPDVKVIRLFCGES
jgi:hypothetical protein